MYKEASRIVRLTFLGYPTALGLEGAIHFPPRSPCFSSRNILFAMVSLLRCNNDMWVGRDDELLAHYVARCFFSFLFFWFCTKWDFFGPKTLVFLWFFTHLKNCKKIPPKKFIGTVCTTCLYGIHELTFNFEWM